MAEDERQAALRIDIVSDVVCPWCIIGWKQLERALQQSGRSAVIFWHPFELNPQMAPEGENLREHVAAKYGTSAADSVAARAKMTALGADLGFAFDYADDMRMVNTFLAHQLLHWAGALGQQHSLKMALFEAFFTRRRDVSDPEVLAEAAAGIGLDRTEALAVLSDGRFAEAVRDEQAFWTSRGIQGVPTVVFNQQYPMVGAQGVENYAAAVGRLAA